MSHAAPPCRIRRTSLSLPARTLRGGGLNTTRRGTCFSTRSWTRPPPGRAHTNATGAEKLQAVPKPLMSTREPTGTRNPANAPQAGRASPSSQNSLAVRESTGRSHPQGGTTSGVVARPGKHPGNQADRKRRRNRKCRRKLLGETSLCIPPRPF